MMQNEAHVLVIQCGVNTDRYNVSGNFDSRIYYVNGIPKTATGFCHFDMDFQSAVQLVVARMKEGYPIQGNVEVIDRAKELIR